MLKFVTGERRDFQPVFDVTVKGLVVFSALVYYNWFYLSFHTEFSDQSKMTLSADIKYKSNGQHAAVKG